MVAIRPGKKQVYMKATIKEFEKFMLDCGIHLLDITPCSDGRLAHSVAYVMRIPFSAVRRRSHAGALFDIENNATSLSLL